jgi:hypothetical protein
VGHTPRDVVGEWPERQSLDPSLDRPDHQSLPVLASFPIRESRAGGLHQSPTVGFVILGRILSAPLMENPDLGPADITLRQLSPIITA